MFGTKNTTRIDTGSRQLTWLILLLAVAVILPTVCLLWFMTEAVENERFATREKLINLYREKLQDAAAMVDARCKNWLEVSEVRAAEGDPAVYPKVLLWAPGTDDHWVCTVVSYDESGNLLYTGAASHEPEPHLPVQFEHAWELEFVDVDFTRASELYEEIAGSTKDDYTWREAVLGQARCEIGRDRVSLARQFYEKAAYGRLDANVPSSSVSLVARARIVVADLERRDDPNSITYLDRLLSTAIQYDGTGPEGRYFLSMDSSTRILVLKKAIEIAEQHPYGQKALLIAEGNPYVGRSGRSWRFDKARWLLAAERLAAHVVERYRTAAAFPDWHTRSVHNLEVPGNIYGLYHKMGERTLLLLGPGDLIRNKLTAVESAFAGSDVAYEIVDDAGILVAGIKQPPGEPFLKVAMGQFFPDWQVRLYFKDADVFDRVARRQVTIYIWAGVLVIVLILAAGGFAGRAVGRQMKLNRLKNDFIATVSHELKTPLSSMRVLADTLLEGNYNDRQQATEYLELICKENKRLSGLIDNFLTFSRMERNKQAFEMASTDPAQIARAAADAVRTKFSKGRCQFTVDIGDDLPDVTADHDAMVTVLANLLDNAYKYSNDDKEIALKVFAEDGSVVFSVRDNGIGMSRRAIKNIFKRFYQVDSSLSRRAEGCGLGLSIAKFIVDAHKGEISVESNPERGSTFTVKLPAAS